MELAAVIRYQGHEYESLDVEKTTADELREIHRVLKLTPRKIYTGLSELEVDVMQAVKWVLEHRRDPAVKLTADDPFTDYWALVNAWLEDKVDAAAKAG